MSDQLAQRGDMRVTLPQQLAADGSLAAFCRRHHIRRLALFGSVLRPDFGSSSDIDVLVEFDPQYTPGYGFFAIQADLSTLFGRPVDLHTPAFLSRHFRTQVMAEAHILYAEA